MVKSNIHQRRMPRRPLPEHIAGANARRSAVRSAVEHVFAGQKHRMGLFIRTIGIDRARIKIGMANLAYNFQRLAWLEGRPHSRKTGHQAVIRPRKPTKPGQNGQPLRAKERDQPLRTGVRPETAGFSS